MGKVTGSLYSHPIRFPRMVRAAGKKQMECTATHPLQGRLVQVQGGVAKEGEDETGHEVCSTFSRPGMVCT